AAAHALGPAIIGQSVLGLRRALKRDAALIAPLLERLEAPGQRHGWKRVRLRAPVFRKRAPLAPNTPPALPPPNTPLEFLPRDGPIDIQPVQGVEAQVLFGVTIARAAPVQCLSANGHRAGYATGRRLILDEIARPRILAVMQHALAVPEAAVDIEQS